jgi:hypothetical protein
MTEDVISSYLLDVTKGRTVGSTRVMGKRGKFDGTWDDRPVHDTLTLTYLQCCLLTSRSETVLEKRH